MELQLNTKPAPNLLFSSTEQAPQKRFVLFFPFRQQNLCVEVLQIDMDGWVLYECFLQPSNSANYISWDNGALAPEWIEMELGRIPAFANELMEALVSFKTNGAIL